MMLNRLLLLAASAFVLAGCSSTPAKVNTGPVAARTFSFIKPGSKPVPDFADNRQPVHEMIQNAITKNLAAKGVTRAETGGNITVGYLVIIDNNGATEAVDDYFGYRDIALALQDKAHDAYADHRKGASYSAGTLVINVIDSQSYKVLKRGHASRRILQNVPADARAARIQEVVDEILQDLRITP
jgi:hypothetical protein